MERDICRDLEGKQENMSCNIEKYRTRFEKLLDAVEIADGMISPYIGKPLPVFTFKNLTSLATAS